MSEFIEWQQMYKIRQFQWQQFARHPGDLAEVTAHSSIPILVTKIIFHITQYTHVWGGYVQVCGLQNMQVKRVVAVHKGFRSGRLTIQARTGREQPLWPLQSGFENKPAVRWKL